MQDSLIIAPDTISKHVSDTIFKSYSVQAIQIKDSLPVSLSVFSSDSLEGKKVSQEPIKSEFTKQVTRAKENKSEIDTGIKIPEESGYGNYNFSDTTEKKFSFATEEPFIIVKGDKNVASGPVQFRTYTNQQLQLNWTLILGLVCISLLLSLKMFYQKFISQVVNTMVNYQLAEKMLREKSIVVRRAFYILNLNFILVISLFLLSILTFWEISITDNSFLDYTILLGIVSAIIIARLLLLYITGYLFGILKAMNEHIHISFLVNKNLGLILLPVVFVILYSSTKISEIAIYSSLVFLAIATFYKLFRAFQIIIRNGVLIFYAFLYLCTLELLPLVLGSKLIISLR